MTEKKQREAILMLLAASAFLVFFQTYLFAPLLPSLAREFGVNDTTIGSLIPAFMLPYGISALFYGVLADRFGRKEVLLVLLGLTVIATLATLHARSVAELIAWRIFGGSVTGGIIPISIALLGDMYPYKERGRPLGWLYSGMAGGAAFGSTLGAYLNPVIGWRWELVAISAISAFVFFGIVRLRNVFHAQAASNASFARTFIAYFGLLRSDRGSRTYVFVFLNSAFHSGVFSWLGIYFGRRYGLGDQGVGLALLGYGIPGLLGGPIIGKWADRAGRNKLIPLGLGIGAFSVLLLAPEVPLFVSATLAAALSLGYDLTQPLFAGIVSSLDSNRRAQSMSLGAFFLFVGFGIGPIIFQYFSDGDLKTALLLFGAIEALLCVSALAVFRAETAAGSAQHG